MKYYTLLFAILISLNVLSQEKRVLSFDLVNGIVDTLDMIDYDTTIQQENSGFYTGNFDDELNVLEQSPPLENTYPESQFTYKRRANLDYNLNKFPLRTSVKLFKWVNDSLKSKCSGSMISSRHVLTACHCVAHINIDSLLYDSLFVCPVYDNGTDNLNFGCSWVKKVHFFENWSISETDFAILELEQPIGHTTGWISMGFDSDDTQLLDGIFYKFSYPATSIPALDSNAYNGDTLYYNYGVADITDENFLGIQYTSGIPGESGSSLVRVQNESEYTTFGVLTYSANLRHSRLTNWKYYMFKSIIKNDLDPNGINITKKDLFKLFPNPTTGITKVKHPPGQAPVKYTLFDSRGIKQIHGTGYSPETTLDLTPLPAGMYLLILESENIREVKRIVKTWD